VSDDDLKKYVEVYADPDGRFSMRGVIMLARDVEREVRHEASQAATAFADAIRNKQASKVRKLLESPVVH